MAILANVQSAAISRSHCRQTGSSPLHCTEKRVSRRRLTLFVFWRKCMGIEPTWEGISPPHWI
jgi:hypothetical protein